MEKIPAQPKVKGAGRISCLFLLKTVEEAAAVHILTGRDRIYLITAGLLFPDTAH